MIFTSSSFDNSFAPKCGSTLVSESSGVVEAEADGVGGARTMHDRIGESGIGEEEGLEGSRSFNRIDERFFTLLRPDDEVDDGKITTGTKLVFLAPIGFVRLE